MAAIETGKIQTQSGFPRGALSPPDCDDVLQSLALDTGDFETWAADFGYEADSRAAEAVYRTCVDQALKLRGVIGASALDELRAIPVD